VLGTGMLSWAATMFCWDARSDFVLGFLLSVVDPESFSPDPYPTFQVVPDPDPDPGLTLF
jgi:hypothetical protein